MITETKEVTVQEDGITKEISALFDYEFNGVSRFTPPKMEVFNGGFGIGLIVGGSGSGKSTLLQSYGKEVTPNWERDKSIASHFISADEAQDRLSAVGLNSIPSWLRPYHVLSTGEAFRADMARKLCDGAVIDEFTSVVDRDVARSTSMAIGKHIRKNNLKGIVFASCHYDIIDWLEPDWVFETTTGKFLPRGWQRPKITISVEPCNVALWPEFSHHHYLDGKINKGSHCWAALWEGRTIGFCAVIAMPSGSLKNAWRGHRTVILPEFQGMGIGPMLSNAVGEIMIASGKRYFSKTAHPRLGQMRDASAFWRATSKNHKARADYTKFRVTKESGHKMKHASRVCYSHEYMGSL
jgi:GNAT superfamily N-acetyltransferase